MALNGTHGTRSKDQRYDMIEGEGSLISMKHGYHRLEGAILSVARKKLSFHGKLLENSWTNFQQIRKEVLLARYLLRLGIFNGYGRAATYWIISYLLTVHE